MFNEVLLKFDEAVMKFEDFSMNIGSFMGTSTNYVDTNEGGGTITPTTDTEPYDGPVYSPRNTLPELMQVHKVLYTKNRSPGRLLVQ